MPILSLGAEWQLLTGWSSEALSHLLSPLEQWHGRLGVVTSVSRIYTLEVLWSSNVQAVATWDSAQALLTLMFKSWVEIKAML